jgi:hypothetical protein
MKLFPMLLLCLALLGPAMVAQAATEPTLTSDKPTVVAGETILFTASGFTADKTITWWITLPDGAVVGGERFRTDGGEASFDYIVPGDAVSGVWAATAYGFDSRSTAITTFTVEGRDPASVPPSASVDPPVGPPSTMFAFLATGFRRGEEVSYWITGPDGLVYESFPRGVRAQPDGAIQFTWQSPGDATPGRWVMTMQGIDSGRARAVAFEIQ